MKDNTNYFIIALVALVAVVGLVVLYLHVTGPSSSDNIAGQGYLMATASYASNWCNDPDGPYNNQYGIKGSISYRLNGVYGKRNDYCIDSVWLTERVCAHNKPYYHTVKCSDFGYGYCYNGKCYT